MANHRVALVTHRDIVCPRSLDLVYAVNYYMKWAKTSWIYSSNEALSMHEFFKNTSPPPPEKVNSLMTVTLVPLYPWFTDPDFDTC